MRSFAVAGIVTGLARLTFGGFFGGWLTDRFGRKRVFFVGPTLFILASVALVFFLGFVGKIVLLGG